MRTFKSVLVSLVVAAVGFLAGFIITINFYTTWKGFEHQPSSRSVAFYWGFLIAGVVAGLGFLVTLYLTRLRRPEAKTRN